MVLKSDHAKNICPDQRTVEDRFETGSVRPRPWPRFFARVLDWLLVGIPASMLVILIFSLFLPASFIAQLFETHYLVFLTIFFYIIVYMPIEALFISRFGTTPLKSAFGITILKQSGAKLSYSEAFKRGYFCLIQGEGLGIPFVTLVTRLFAYQRLTKTSTTLWDTEVGSVVHHKRFNFWRFLLCGMLMITGIFVYGVLYL